MSDRRKVGTSAEVWAVIKARHPELVVFSSYSAPDGDQWGDPEKCTMMTEYGFSGADFPIIGAETTWTKNHDKPYERTGQIHEYWLCIGIDSDE